MKIGRRGLLAMAPAAGIAAAMAAKAAVIKGPRDEVRRQQGSAETPGRTGADPLPAYFDTLIPKDQMPGATELGVDRLVREAARRVPGYAKLLHGGANWLNGAARRSAGMDFAGLAQRQRDEIVAFAAAAKSGTLPRVFFDRTRYDAMRLYYADARSWPALHFDGPPQPRGFPDHAKAPAILKP